MSNFFRPRLFVLFVPLLILAASLYAFAAANTVPDTKAGDGFGAVSGYTVSNITYLTTISDTDATTLDRINFDLDSTALTAQVKPVLASSTWYDCTNPAANGWTCVISPTVAVVDMDQLRVVATGN